jgi:hypothetical protein
LARHLNHFQISFEDSRKMRMALDEPDGGTAGEAVTGKRRPLRKRQRPAGMARRPDKSARGEGL